MHLIHFTADSCSLLNAELTARQSERLCVMEQLGKDISITRATISNFENEQRKPSLDMIIKLADYFQVSIDYLVGRTDDPTFHHTKRD